MNKLLVAVSLAAAGLSAWAETPDFLADGIRSDGLGYIDTGIPYKAVTSPKTKRITMDYHDDDWGWGGTSFLSSGRRVVFGIWLDSGDVTCFSYTSGHTGQLCGSDWKAEIEQSIKTGDMTASIDYSAKTFSWGGASGSLRHPIAKDLTANYYIFGWNRGGKSGNYGIVTMKRFQLYTTTDDGATEDLAQELVPCCKDGRAAVYDTVSQKIIYPTSDGFTLSGDYGYTVAADRTLTVTGLNCSPTNLTFDGSASLVFDGIHTLKSTKSVIVLPGSGKVTVSLLESTGRGRYVLLDNLPDDYDLATFTLAATPAYTTGELEKDGATLVLVLTSTRLTPPEAICASITSDATNWIDTGYAFRGAEGTTPKTKRVTIDFHDTTYGKGAAPGPTIDPGNTSPAVLGFWKGDGTSLSCCRWTNVNTGPQRQFWGNGWQSTASVQNPKTGDQTVTFDYFEKKATWDSFVLDDLAVPPGDAPFNYTIFSWNFDGKGGSPAYFDFKGLQVYETSDGGVTETLARDFVPCVSDGSAAIYDRVTGAQAAPSSPEHSFTYADPCWRLTTGDDVGFNAVGTQLNLSGPADADGYAVIEDVSGSVLQRGLGRAFTLVMPAAAVSVLWTKDETVDAGATRNVAGLVGCNTLTLGANAKLVFAAGGKLVLSEGLSLPGDGKVFVSAADLSLPGTYVLAVGVEESTRVAAFEVAEVADGLKGTVARIGDKLVLRLEEDATAAGAIVGRTLTSDRNGWIDTGYFYKGKDYPRTTRVEFHCVADNYGFLPGETKTGSPSMFGFLVDGTIMSYCRYGGNANLMQVWGGNDEFPYDEDCKHGHTTTVLKGDRLLTIDYLTGNATWGPLSFSGIPTSTRNSSKSYWLAGVNGNNSPSYLDILSFKAWEIDEEGGSERLACDMIPAQKAGEPGMYDRVAKRFTAPTYKEDATGHGFALDLGEVAQEFVAVSTRCNGQLVALPAFAPQDELTFLADGIVRAKTAVESLVMTGYDAAGAVVSTATVTPVEVGKAYCVTLGEAAKVVVKVVGASLGTVAQDFEKAGAVGDAESLERKVSKYEYEYMVAGAATLTFKADVTSVVADLYDASGAKIGEETLAGAVDAGAPLAIAAHATAVYRIVRVSLRRPGALIFIR